VGNTPTRVAITPDGTHAYVTNQNSNTVSVIDTTTNTVTATIHVGGIPSGVAITPDGAHAYVTNQASNTVSVIDTATNTVTATIHVGGGPFGVAITPDGAHAYVANQGSGAAFVINTATNTVTAIIAVGRIPFGVAITPRPSLTVTKTHRGTFGQREKNTYRITVTNNGTGPTDGTTVTVTDTLPTGLTAVSLRGTGWTCTRATLTCARNDTLTPGASYPTIKLRVKVSCRAPEQVTNTVTVTGGGSTPDTATDPTTIKRGRHCEKQHHHHSRHDKKDQPGRHDAPRTQQ
ncbi:YncE family protein, partial [Streptomyces sp. NPDC047022]|uniref:YncE family protein n=1 Tax=Streptomyces sp. NPDC047022 TaxID=3155737 RepID=UPI0033C11A9C